VPTRLPGIMRTAFRESGGAADFDLELLESHTLDGRIQELIYRPTLHPGES
jgi:hypothetical protein